ncbi:Phospholipase A2 domain-containing protein [Aphelenchoides besseyi]|nr:Phospholipase A2 domain-containing protein [Aphelenchoides besseyi]KAI6200708.1 Phospholipase A2 domain-containing protein [Aphelenchoides besseyi]
MGRWDDEMPLLVETSDFHHGYRKEGTTVYVARRGPLNRGGMSGGTIKLTFALMFLILLTLIFIVTARYSNQVRNSTVNIKKVPMTSKIKRSTTQTLKTVTIKPLVRIRPTPKLKQLKQTTSRASIQKNYRNDQVTKLHGSWECGSAAVSKQISKQLIERDCPQLLNSVNGYDEQLGQKECDEGFCDCLNRVTLDPISNSTAKCHDDHGLWFCEMVKAFGDSYYENAGLNTTLHVGFVDIFGEPQKLPLNQG